MFKKATKQNTECYFEFKVSLSCKVHSIDMVQRTLWHSLSQINSYSPGIDCDEELFESEKMWMGLGSFITRHLQTAWSYLYDIIKTIPPRVSLQDNKYFIEMCTIKMRNVTSRWRLDPVVMSLDLKEEVKLCINNSPWRSLDGGGERDGIPGLDRWVGWRRVALKLL